jgi:hypothetical protein
LLALQNLSTNLPVDLDELGVDRAGRTRLGTPDASLDVLEKLLIAPVRARRLGGGMNG